MLVELFGIDGSGKTTLAKLLRRRFIAAGRRCYIRDLKSSYRLLLATIAAERGMSREDFFGSDAVELASALETVDRHHLLFGFAADGPDFYVADRYVVASLGTAISRGASNVAQLTDVYRRCRVPDVSIRLRIDPELARARALNRPESDTWVAEGGIQMLHDLDRGLDEAVASLGWDVWEFDTGPSSEEAIADAVFARIGAICGM